MSAIQLLTKSTLISVGKSTGFVVLLKDLGTDPSFAWNFGNEIVKSTIDLIRYEPRQNHELSHVLNDFDRAKFIVGSYYATQSYIFDSDGTTTVKVMGYNRDIEVHDAILELEVVHTMDDLKLFVSETLVAVNKIVNIVFTVRDPGKLPSFVLSFNDLDHENVTNFNYSDTVKPIERLIGLSKTDFDELIAKGFFYGIVEKKFSRKGTITIKLRVYNKGIKKTTLSLNINVVEMICKPNVTVTNVVQNLSTPIIEYHRRDTIRLGIETTILCTHRQLKGRTWSLFKITSSTVRPNDERNRVFLPKNIIMTSKVLEIPGKTLAFGKYFVLLKVIIVQEEREIISIGSGYFEVILSPLQAIIIGGNLRSLSVSETLVLDGSESRNPNGDDISYVWYCSSKPARDPANMCLNINRALTWTQPVLKFAPGKFRSGTTYTFKLTVQGKFKEETPNSVEQKIVIGALPSTQIICLHNCKMKINPEEKLVLEATCSNYAHLLFSWDIFGIDSTGREISINWAECSGHGNKRDTLYLTSGCLTFASRYIAKVSVTSSRNSAIATSSYIFDTSIPPSNGTCSISPKSGEALLTQFEVRCSGFKDEDGPLVYKIYFENGLDIEGSVTTKLVASHLGILLQKRYDQGSKLMYIPIGNAKTNYSGNVTIVISDYYGLSLKIPYSIQVFPPKSLSQKQLEKIVLSREEGSIDDLLHVAGDVEGAVNLANCVAEILNSESLPHVSEEERGKIRRALIKTLEKIPQQGFGFAAETLATIEMLLQADGDEIDVESSGVAVGIMEKIASNLTASILEDDVNTQLVYDAALNAFSAASSLMQLTAGTESFLTNIPPENKSTSNPEKEKRCSVSSKVLKVIDDISDALLTTSTRGEEDMYVDSASIGIWLRKTDTSHNMGDVMGKKGKDAIKLPPMSLLGINDTSKYNLDIKMVSSPFNPYVCSDEGNLVNTHVVSLAIDALSKKSRKQLSPEGETPDLVEVFLTRRGLPESVRSNVTTEGFPDEYDIKFHTTVITTPGITIHIQIDRENTNYSLLLAWAYDCIPQKEQFRETPYVVPATNENKSFLLTLSPQSNETLRKGEYALGILPYAKSIVPSLRRNDSELAFDDSKEPAMMTYNLTIFVSKCMYFDVKKQKWSDKGCKVGPETNEIFVHCICGHMSLFSASFLVAPNTVDVTKTVELFSTAKDNFVVIGFMIAAWLIYFCLLGYALKKDKDDAKSKHTVVLQDNKASELYPYIIQIFTGIRPDAGTSATVQIQLHGSRLNSRVRHLTSPNRPLFETGGEDWFLLKTERALGQLRGITISHDNTGKNPNWYLSQIKVLDPEAGRSWIFLVHQWISISLNKGSAILYVSVVPERDLKKFKIIFRQRALNELRDRHMWFSVFQCSPRSEFTRAQRVTCAFSMLVAAMLINIMFFGIVPTSQEREEVDKGNIYKFLGVTINIKVIIIGLQSSLMAYPIGFFIIQTFALVKPRESDEDEVKKLIEEAHWEIHAESVGSAAPSFMSGVSRDSLEPFSSQQRRNLYHFEGSMGTIPEFLKEFWNNRCLNISETSLSIKNNFNDTPTAFSEVLYNEKDYFYPAPMRTKMDFSPREFEFNAKEAFQPELEPHYFTCHLPWWFIYVSWFLVIFLSLICTYFIMLYGLTYGYKKSMEWFESNVMSFAENNFFLDPLQVLIVLIVSSYLMNTVRMKHQG